MSPFLLILSHFPFIWFDIILSQPWKMVKTERQEDNASSLSTESRNVKARRQEDDDKNSNSACNASNDEKNKKDENNSEEVGWFAHSLRKIGLQDRTNHLNFHLIWAKNEEKKLEIMDTIRQVEQEQQSLINEIRQRRYHFPDSNLFNEALELYHRTKVLSMRYADSGKRVKDFYQLKAVKGRHTTPCCECETHFSTGTDYVHNVGEKSYLEKFCVGCMGRRLKESVGTDREVISTCLQALRQQQAGDWFIGVRYPMYFREGSIGNSFPWSF